MHTFIKQKICMHKYKYFLIFFSGIVLLLLLCFFPISFDNNDDQAMYFICSGILSGVSSPNIAHTNLIIGLALNKLFALNDTINWYTVYLQLVQMSALLTIYFILIYNKGINFLLSVLLLTFLIFGFSVLCVVKLQYTIVALLSCAAALCCIYSELPTKNKYLLALFFITAMILIRKDSFYIFIGFNVPILFLKFSRWEFDKSHILILANAVVLFYILSFINHTDTMYQKTQMYKYFKALDDAGDKPVKYTSADLKAYGFTEDDMILIKARYPASESYSAGPNIIQLSEKIKSKRSIEEMSAEIKKFIADERYILLVYLLSIIFLLYFSPRLYPVVFLNGIIILGFLAYLSATIRIPHRVTFPLLIYVSVVNLYFFAKAEIKNKSKMLVLFLFAILGIYKFYCTCKLIDMHKENHTIFSTCRNEINRHPDYLFIALHDGFPVEYMNAWQAPKNLFPKNNLIMTGWNVWAPDFRNVLQHHQLKNITTDLKNKQHVVFLTNSQTYMQAFINVMKQRYNLSCHFEPIQEDFKTLRPKKLIFEN